MTQYGNKIKGTYSKEVKTKNRENNLFRHPSLSKKECNELSKKSAKEIR